MKKKVWIGMLTAFAVLSVCILFMVACKKKEPPQAPTGLRVNASDGYVTWTWNPVEDADYYYAKYYGGSEPVYGTSYTRGRFINEVDLTFEVAAVNEYGESAYSSLFYHYSPNNGGGGNGGGSGSTTISAPTGVSAEVSGSRVCVTWNSVSNASKYRVYRSSSSGGTYSMLDYTTNTYYYDSSPNTENYYKVTAVNSNGDESERSSYAYCYYSSGGGGGGSVSAPSAPTGVSAEVSGSRIKVSWNSVSNATQYTVYWSTSASGSYSSIGTTSSTYIYDDNPSSNNYYKVKAKNSYGESSYSSYAYCQYSSGGGGGGSTNYAPCPPTVSASGTASSISVSWTKATGTGCGNPTSYKVYKRDPISGSYELRTTTSSTSYRDSDVHPGINRYAVEAINNYGSDEGYGYSSEIPLSKPTSFSAQKSGNDRINFTWSKVSQATGYDIFMSTSAYGTYTTFQGTEDNVTSLNIYYPGESGHTYYFKIRAYWRYGYGQYIFSDFTTYKSVTF